MDLIWTNKWTIFSTLWRAKNGGMPPVPPRTPASSSRQSLPSTNGVSAVWNLFKETILPGCTGPAGVTPCAGSVTGPKSWLPTRLPRLPPMLPRTRRFPCSSTALPTGSDAYQATGTIPYVRPWVGVFHHTFNGDDPREPNSLGNVFRNPAFLASLPTCHCIVLLSHYLERQFRKALDAAGFSYVRTQVLLHLTELVPEEKRWSSEKFRANIDHRKLLQVGSWLREAYALYDLALPDENPVRLRKAVLKAKDMGPHLPPADFFEVFDRYKSPKGGDGGPCGYTTNDVAAASSSSLTNKWVASLVHNVKLNIASVEVLENVDNSAYDELLDRNVVFLKLFDCSAVNTVLECMARTTPLIVNRHPALVELLGPNYPGFYANDHEAVCIAMEPARIERCHRYLASLDKGRLKLSYFVSELFRSIFAKA